MHVNEVPDPRNPDCVPVAGSTNEGRNVAGVILCRPNPVTRDFDGREPDPFAARCAVIIKVQTRMIHQDRQTAANQHHHEQKIEEMTVTHPERKAVRPRKVIRIDLRDRGNIRQADKTKLNPRDKKQ